MPSASDPRLAPPGDSTVFVLVPVPLLGENTYVLSVQNGLKNLSRIADVIRRLTERQDHPTVRVDGNQRMLDLRP